MMVWRRLISWLRATIAADAQSREIEEELRAHLEHDIDARMAAGVDRAEAERQARAAFGSVTALREQSREAHGTRWLDQLLQDSRYGVRVLIRYRAFSVTAVLTLALTIGAVATVLTLVDAFYFQRWPVEDADRIVQVRALRRPSAAGAAAREARFSWAEYEHFRDGATSFESLVAAYASAPLFVDAGDEVFEVAGAVVSADFFAMLRLQPVLGRFFSTAEDAVPGRDRVVVISENFWRRQFGGSTDALGAALTINETDFRIVGVAPARFRSFDAAPIEIYMPTMMLDVGYRWCSALQEPDCTVLELFGRLHDDATVSSAAAEVATLYPQQWRDAGPEEESFAEVREVRGRSLSGVDAQFLELLVLAAAALLAVCCANLGGLLVARGRERMAELAVRASLGASRGRLVRQLTTEALLLAVAGGVAGTVVSVALTALLQARFYVLDSSGRPLDYDFALRPALLGWVALLAVVAGLLYGWLPAWSLLRRQAALAPRAGCGRVSALPAHQGLLVLQVAGAVALVSLAALLGASATARVEIDTVDPDHVALLRLRPRLVAYAPDRAQAYVREVIERLEATPGVESATMVGSGIALLGLQAQVQLPAAAASTTTGFTIVGPRYFETLGTPVLSGREFTAADNVAAPRVAVVSAALARGLWPAGDALGSLLTVNGAEHTVVGVVADIELQPRGEPPRPYVYTPFWQDDSMIDARLQVRVAGDPSTLIPTLVREIQEVDPRVPVTETITLRWRLAGMFRPQRMSATAIAYAGGLAAMLAGLGLYASFAAAVANRRKEFGIRQAIGASAAGIVRMMLGEGLRLTLVGVALGLAGAYLASRTLQHLLYGAPDSDPLWIAGAALLVVAIASVACWVPARRAARVLPMVALRLD